MSFEVDVRATVGGMAVARRFATGAGITLLFGPSGVGKTSLLNMVAGLLRPDAGRIAVAGRALYDSAAGLDLPPEARGAGYVFQDNRLFPHRRVRANLRYGEARARRALIGFDEAVALLGLGGLLDRWPATLSGGEARRVAIGRALLSGPDFLLMDEPLSFLDAPRRAEITAMILRIRERLTLPILYVTHDADEAARLADHRVDLG